MTLSIFGTFQAQGTPEEMALFMALLVSHMQTLQRENEKEDIQKSIQDLFDSLDRNEKKNGGDAR